MISKNKVKYYASFKQKKVREVTRRFLVEGIRNCEELFKSERQIETVLYCQDRLTSARGKKLIQKCRQAEIPVSEIDSKSLARLASTVHSQGILALSARHEFTLSQVIDSKPNLLLALDQITEPGNLGTIIRTANWFGVGGVFLSENSVELTNPKVIRASMGSLFHVPVLDKTDLPSALLRLRDTGYTLFVADLDGDNVYSSVTFPRKTVLVLGNEVAGVRPAVRSVATAVLKIPKTGQGDSLNVSVAAGIILSEMSRAIFSNA